MGPEKMERSLQLSYLHYCVNHVSKPLTVCAVERLLCKLGEDGFLLLHLIIVSFVADILESEVLLSIKSKNRTVTSWHMCKLINRGPFVVYWSTKADWDERLRTNEQAYSKQESHAPLSTTPKGTGTDASFTCTRRLLICSYPCKHWWLLFV